MPLQPVMQRKIKAAQDPIPQDLIPEESSRPIPGLVSIMSGRYWCGEGDEADELMEAAADPRVRTAPEDFEEVQAMLGARNPKYAGG